MIVMTVRDHNDVDIRQRVDVRQRAVPLERSQSPPKERIGEDPDGIELDEDGGVTDES